MASKTEIANRALQRLGAKRITDLTEDSRNARAIAAAYESVKLAELRKYNWSFAIKRAQLASSVSTPLFGRSYIYPLPADFVRLLPLDPEQVSNNEDYQIEGRNILTNESSPLNMRYVYNVTDPNEMDSLFRETFACKLAEELCEEITQSNTKIQTVIDAYKDIIAEAKKAGAIEKTAQQPPEDSWVTVRD